MGEAGLSERGDSHTKGGGVRSAVSDWLFGVRGEAQVGRGEFKGGVVEARWGELVRDYRFGWWGL